MPEYRAMQYRSVQAAAGQSVDVANRTITRYGVVFDSDSEILKIRNKAGKAIRIVEQIKAESLKGVIMDDVICTVNHKFENILGRMSNSTLTLEMDETGIKYTVEVGNTSYGNDLLENISRRDIVGSSFIFVYDAEEGYHIEQREDGTLVGYPKNIIKIVEMGPVTTPAYKGTEQRSAQHPLIAAAEQFLNGAEAEAQQRSTANNEDTEERAMDVMRLVDLVRTEFYKAFEGNGVYYYVRSVTVDNNLVAKEQPSNLFYKVGFEVSEDNEITFAPKEDWIQVEMEYVPVSAARSFYETLKPEVEATEQRATDEAETVAEESPTPTEKDAAKNPAVKRSMVKARLVLDKYRYPKD